MSAPIPLTDRQRTALHAALRLFGDGDRQRGMHYLRQRRVLAVKPGVEEGADAAFAAEPKTSGLEGLLPK